MEVMDCLLDPCSSELGSLGERRGEGTQWRSWTVCWIPVLVS